MGSPKITTKKILIICEVFQLPASPTFPPKKQQIMFLKDLSPEQNMSINELDWEHHINSFDVLALFCYRGRGGDRLGLSLIHFLGCSLFCA